jgi:hypothetical protein
VIKFFGLESKFPTVFRSPRKENEGFNRSSRNVSLGVTLLRER